MIDYKRGVKNSNISENIEKFDKFVILYTHISLLKKII